MKPTLVSKLIPLFIISIVLSLLQYGILSILNIESYYNTISIYSFHFILTLITYIALHYINLHFPDKVGFTFMGCSTLKMFACILFLLPLLLSEKENKITDILLFFIPYFLFLSLEAIYAFKLVNNQSKNS
ncbi:hypothetical protein GGR32_001625 [Mesonia hippocampi]|uniref:Uncharacterized protein n=1 Tax=Mesonia hippocampi TaxID=1628250 RepID=A0A840EWX7_9FLAO|nr:hypothetical protein [Mesonia hippocampi]MBB4119327.1 hypothetical protein [Mesonia hippocampi]